jgi:mono/diheme cytochrome c family protein
MTSSVITVIAVVVGIAWLGVLLVSALRNRGKEEVPPNLKPGINDQELETTRLETGQKAAIAFSAFLAISLPLYFLSEPARQEGFVEQFDEESITRGEHIVAEYRCFDCHGPEGVGGSASYIEKRSNVAVSWAAPSLNDVFYRYDEDELTFWITYGRGNTPMPAWGLPGGGPLNEAQVQDVINYLRTLQVTQAEAANRVPDPVTVELDRLDAADATLRAAIISQDQVVHDVMNAPDDAALIAPLAEEATTVLEESTEGIDSDGDGVSDAAETALSAISLEAYEGLTVVADVAMDSAVADAEKADEALVTLEAAVETDPIVTTNLEAVQDAFENGTVEPGGISATATEDLTGIAESAAEIGADVPAGPYDTETAGQALVDALTEASTAEGADASLAQLAGDATAALDAGKDADGDGFSASAEQTITNAVAEARTSTNPLTPMTLDPTNPASVGGVPDLTTADDFVADLNAMASSLTVTTENQEGILATEQAGLDYLLQAAEDRAFEIDIAGVAASMGVDQETAARAVGLFNANCARCHTAGFSAGLPFTLEAGSGGFGPALWDGRPTVQFGEAVEPVSDDLLVQFIIRGSEAQRPYGLNGFGSGRMPAFGAILPEADIELLAAYLRAGNLDGKG